MKIELTIKADYLPSWSVWEGLRELIQNAKDAETEFGARMEVRHHKASNTLIIENTGCTIPHEALLFGHTTKADRSDMIGKFGEGLKLGILCLVRGGHDVRIRSGSEVWIPSIAHSEKFDAEVLVFNIERGRANKPRVQIEVGSITEEDWEAFRPCFLFFDSLKSDEKIPTSFGTLLLNPGHAGKLFVKGVFVESDSKFQLGYDFVEGVSLDRDRKMIARWDMGWRAQSIWAEALAVRPDLFDRFMLLVEAETSDVNGVDEDSAKRLPKGVLERAKKEFHTKFGNGAVPVATLAESKDIDHLGKTGVIVNKPLRLILQAVMGQTSQVKEDLKKAVARRYSWSELTEVEKVHLEAAIFFVNSAERVTLDDVEVVDFRSDSLWGMFEKDAEKEHFLIAKAQLANRAQTLRILVHEVAHREGGDGDKDHVMRIEKIWSAIVELLLTRT